VLFRKLRAEFLWISACVLIAGLVLATLASRRITEPLYRLKSGIDHFSSGNLAYRIPGEGRDEGGGVAMELNRMAGRMEEAERSRRLAAMGLMMGGAAHDLKNPIHALTKGLELMSLYLSEIQGAAVVTGAGPEQESRVAERLERMKIILIDGTENLERMAKLVEDILSLGRIDAARFERLDVREILERAVAEMRPRLEGVAELRCDLGVGRAEVLGAPALKLVFTNLLVHAVQSIEQRRKTERGGSEVAVKLSNDPDVGVRVTVRDDGAGIGPADRERLFEPFFTTKRVGEGTGLGLFLAHEIVVAHGGRLKGTSEGPNRGATFVVELPDPVRAASATGRESGT
jgi:signal transduction histidine kinase